MDRPATLKRQDRIVELALARQYQVTRLDEMAYFIKGHLGEDHMKDAFRRLACLGGVTIIGMSVIVAAPANANAVTAMAGFGGISPGLTNAGGAQTFFFTGSGEAVLNNLLPSAIICNISGDDTIGTLTSGSGSLSGTCTTTEGIASVSSGTYERTGATVTVDAFATGGGLNGFFTGVCSFEPTSPPPVVSYAAQCMFEA